VNVAFRTTQSQFVFCNCTIYSQLCGQRHASMHSEKERRNLQVVVPAPVTTVPEEPGTCQLSSHQQLTEDCAQKKWTHLGKSDLVYSNH
jgi:hypothetical protein